MSDPVLDPVLERNLERLKKDWEQLKTIDEKHNIERLKLRATIAERIRDSYTAGGTRKMVAETLGVSEPRVTRLVQGNYNFGPASVHRTGTAQHRLPILVYSKEDGLAIDWVKKQEDKLAEKIPVHYKKSGRKPPCKYCGSDAVAKVEIPNKAAFFVCATHRPPG